MQSQFSWAEILAVIVHVTRYRLSALAYLTVMAEYIFICV